MSGKCFDDSIRRLARLDLELRSGPRMAGSGSSAVTDQGDSSRNVAALTIANRWWTSRIPIPDHPEGRSRAGQKTEAREDEETEGTKRGRSHDPRRGPT